MNLKKEKLFSSKWKSLIKNSVDYFERNILIFIVFSIIVFLIILFGYLSNSKINTNEDKEEVITQNQPFYDISIIAKSAIVKDVTTGNILYAKNEDVALPLASITKIMTAYVSSKILNDDKSTNITEYALMAAGEYGFELGDPWPNKTLRDVTLIKSANDGARALSIEAGRTLTSSNEDPSKLYAFVDKMNQTSRELGLTNTSFKNPSGLDIGFDPSAVGSARDIANMFEYVLVEDRSILEATTKKEIRAVVAGENYRYINTNKIVGEIPNLIASKTGFEDTAGGNLAVVYDAGLNHPVIIVVLGSTKEGRFEDVANLVNATDLFFTQNKVEN